MTLYLVCLKAQFYIKHAYTNDQLHWLPKAGVEGGINPISTVLKTETGIVTLYGCGMGVAWVWHGCGLPH